MPANGRWDLSRRSKGWLLGPVSFHNPSSRLEKIYQTEKAVLSVEVEGGLILRVIMFKLYIHLEKIAKYSVLY